MDALREGLEPTRDGAGDTDDEGGLTVGPERTGAECMFPDAGPARSALYVSREEGMGLAFIAWHGAISYEGVY